MKKVKITSEGLNPGTQCKAGSLEGYNVEDGFRSEGEAAWEK